MERYEKNHKNSKLQHICITFKPGLPSPKCNFLLAFNSEERERITEREERPLDPAFGGEIFSFPPVLGIQFSVGSEADQSRPRTTR